jgi:hypothetical protein
MSAWSASLSPASAGISPNASSSGAASTPRWPAISASSAHSSAASVSAKTVSLVAVSPASTAAPTARALSSYVLSEEAFDALIAERPLIAVRVLANLARELSVRLRNATRMISELER